MIIPVIFNSNIIPALLCEKKFCQENPIFLSELIPDFNCSSVSLPNKISL
jgi:hypothetical protein